MQIASIAFVFIQVLAVFGLERRDPVVLTAERIYKELVDQSPFIVQRTTTISWTQSASITVAQPTTAPTPSVAY
ncbi:hypothetical protein M413DRAFT_447064 [Hebeloma cylindrosporum]|uniref:Secreted protein n=1 Tax=Hebeloma cylindrosporum TaxID=76867 RepID=A0A0C3BSD4_HEBCY|nr:hypothetical protein M413DRAFT_447064 [Hebeloma cylindrosporum h7]